MTNPIVELHISSGSAQTSIQDKLQLGYKLKEKLEFNNDWWDNCANQMIINREVLLIWEHDEYCVGAYVDDLKVTHNKIIKDRNDTIADLKKKVRELENTGYKWERINNDLEFTIKSLNDKMDNSKARVKRAEMLEQDLVKIRNAIGELKFNEIILEEKD